MLTEIHLFIQISIMINKKIFAVCFTWWTIAQSRIILNPHSDLLWQLTKIKVFWGMSEKTVTLQIPNPSMPIPVNGEEQSIIEQAQTVVLQQFKREIVDPVAAFCGRYPRAEDIKVSPRRKRFIPQALQILGTIGLSAGTASYF